MPDAITAGDQPPASSLQPPASNASGAIAWVILSGLALTTVALVIGAPLAQAHNHLQFASAIYWAFSFVCHQLPERSFHLDDHQFAVCSRCTGLYSGFALATLFYPLTRSLTRTDTPSRRWLLLAVVPLAIDFSLGYFDIWANTQLTRVATGALLGSVAVFYIMPGLIQLAQMIRWRVSAH
jgi:uncharacterized membrane protein